MPDDARVQGLIEVMLDSGCSAEEACRETPELLAQVREGWRRFRAVEARLLLSLGDRRGTDRLVDESAPLLSSDLAAVAVQAALSNHDLPLARARLDRWAVSEVEPGAVLERRLWEAILGRITTTTDLAHLGESRIVVEAATERSDLKFDLFRHLDDLSGGRNLPFGGAVEEGSKEGLLVSE